MINEHNVLEIYPAIEQLLKRCIRNMPDVKAGRTFSALIQYEGFTTNINFDWFWLNGMFTIRDIKLEKLSEVPTEQYDLEC